MENHIETNFREIQKISLIPQHILLEINLKY